MTPNALLDNASGHPRETFQIPGVQAVQHGPGSSSAYDESGTEFLLAVTPLSFTRLYSCAEIASVQMERKRVQETMYRVQGPGWKWYSQHL